MAATTSKYTFVFSLARPVQNVCALGMILYQDDSLIEGKGKANAKIRSSDVVYTKINSNEFPMEKVDLSNISEFSRQLEFLRNHSGFSLTDSSYNTRHMFNVFKECEQIIFETLNNPPVHARGLSILEASIFRQAFQGSDMATNRFKLMAFEGWPPAAIPLITPKAMPLNTVEENSLGDENGEEAPPQEPPALDESGNPIASAETEEGPDLILEFQKELSAIAQHLDNQCITFSFTQSEDSVPVISLNPGDIIYLQSSTLPAELHENLKYVPGAIEKKNTLTLPARVVRLYLYNARNKIIVLSNIVNKIYAFSIGENIEQRVKLVLGKNREIYEKILNDSYGVAVMNMIDIKTPLEFSPIIRMEESNLEDHQKKKTRNHEGENSVRFDHLIVGTAILLTGLALYIVYVFFSD